MTGGVQGLHGSSNCVSMRKMGLCGVLYSVHVCNIFYDTHYMYFLYLKNGDTLLMKASSMGNVRFVYLLLKKGVQVNHQNKVSVV